jgi:hypothetical protein
MSRLRVILCLAYIAAGAALADDSLVTTPEPAVTPSEPAEAASSVEPVAPQRVLVTATGRVVQGSISETAGGYHVSTPNGNFTITFNDVLCTATDVRDAHHKLQKLFVPPSASGHVILGRWCMENRLYDLAMDEVQAALHLEPARAEARNLLGQLESILNPRAEHQENMLTLEAVAAPPVPAPGGLTRETTLEFVRRIQPLMLNSCSNARCHGSPEASFHLEFVSSSGVGSQAITTKNIEAVFALVDIDNPSQSRLFTALQDSEIPEHRQVLLGPRGREQLTMIADWITQGSLERGGKPQPITAPEVQIASAQIGADRGAVEPAVAEQAVESPSTPHVPMTLDDAPAISIEPLPIEYVSSEDDSQARSLQ